MTFAAAWAAPQFQHWVKPGEISSPQEHRQLPPIPAISQEQALEPSGQESEDESIARPQAGNGAGGGGPPRNS